MTQQFAEILLMVPAALTTGFVLFLPTVVQKIMEDMEASEFKKFLTMLTSHALKSYYAITISTITFVGMFPYWYFYGFSNWWFTAGLVMWTVASIISKYTTLPVYSRVTGRKFPGYKAFPELKSSDTSALKKERVKLHTANILRSWLCLLSVVLMIIGLY